MTRVVMTVKSAVTSVAKLNYGTCVFLICMFVKPSRLLGVLVGFSHCFELFPVFSGGG